MRTRWIWLSVVGVFAVTVGTLAWLPGYQLKQEIAAARLEGLPTEVSDIRKAIGIVAAQDNAVPLIRAAIEADRSETRNLFGSALGDIVKGSASATQKADLRKALLEHPEALTRWRIAAFYPKADFQRRWEEGESLLLPEYSRIKEGAQLLVAAARVGVDPESNLQAAGKLSALVRQDPTMIAQLVGIKIGRDALRAAPNSEVAKRIEATLGPPINVRWAMLAEPSATLWLFHQPAPSGQFSARSLLIRVGPAKANAELRAIRQWRTLWRELPKDGRDYDLAASVIERRLPGIYDTLAAYAPNMDAFAGDASEVPKIILRFKQFEELRKSIREKALQLP